MSLAASLTSAFSELLCPDRLSSSDHRAVMAKTPAQEGRNTVILERATQSEFIWLENTAEEVWANFDLSVSCLQRS
jgi:hypothetical protein